jgi:hypothetical protein
MKKQTQHWLIIILILQLLTACQPKQEQATEGETVYLPQSSSGDNTDQSQNETAPQNEDAYPLQTEGTSQIETAYPVSKDDLKLLDRNWYLYAYREDGIDVEPASKSLTFSGNRYAITTDEGTITGSWTARIESPDPILVLDSAAYGTLFYEIINLDEKSLNLRTVRDQIQIEEDYLPVD